MLELRLLGGAALEGDDEVLPPAARHRYSLALLALLATAPNRTLHRGKVVALLWPEVPERTARNRLNTVVHRLRKALDTDAITSVGEGLRLNEGVVRCDVLRFRAANEAGDPGAAVALYQGPFLDGFWLRGSPEFERWIDAERDRLEREHHAALEALAEAAEARGDVTAATRWWRERSVADPYDSRVAKRLVRALVGAGNRAEALRVAREHARRMSDDLGAEPGEALQRLIESLLQGEGGSDPVADVAGGPHAAGDTPSVAVLLFEELGQEGAEAGTGAGAFADGLHNDVLTRLSRLGGLKVISRTSVLRYRTARPAVPEIAAELGVNAVVEGGVQHAGGRVRLNVQLIDATRDVHVWAETYERELTTGNLFDIQSELAERIAVSLRRELTPSERERLREWAPTQDLEAYRSYAEGRARLDERTEQGMRRALEHFETAIERDEEYALARVGAADTLTLLHEYGYEPAERVLPRAEAFVRRAIELDPGLAEAHASLGLLHEARQEGPRAILELERAVELQPGYAEAHNWLSWTNQLLGRPREALRSARRAVELNPLSPESVSNLSVSSMMNGRFEEAVEEARRAGEMQPGWTTPPFYEALALLELQRFDETIERLRDLSVSWTGRGAEATVALAHAAAGRGDRARAMQAELERAGERCAVGLIHAALGDVDRAFSTLVRIERWSYWATLSIHHYYPGVLATLRQDRRYADLRARVNRAWGLQPDGALPPSTAPGSPPSPSGSPAPPRSPGAQWRA